MPALSRWCVRAALVYLVGGMAMGSWILILEATRGYGPGAPWPSLHAHVLLMGFLLLLVIGVAFWMFPRVRGARPAREGGWIAFALINAGLLLRLLAEPRVSGQDAAVAWEALLVLAAVLPALGALAFAVAIAPRVRAALTPEEARRLRAAHAARTGGPPPDQERSP